MSAPTHRQIRAAIVAVLSAVNGIGRVHGFERYATGRKALADLYVADGRVLGWFVRRASRRERSGAIGRTVVDQRWLIRGYMSLDDAAESELAFDDLIEAIGTAFRADETLGNVVATTVTEQAAGLQLEDSGPVMFAGVLCHAARMTLPTRHYH